MTRVVISECHGGFGLSRVAQDRLRELGWGGGPDYDIDRADPLLLKVIEEMGTLAASGGYAKLVVIDVPDDVKWHIHASDGFESIHEEKAAEFYEGRSAVGQVNNAEDAFGRLDRLVRSNEEALARAEAGLGRPPGFLRSAHSWVGR